MKKITFLKSILAALMLLVGSFGLVAQTTINFDTDANWVKDPAVSLTSYGAHAYVESGVTFQGTNVLRNTNAAQDGFPGAQGTYSFRLRDQATSKVQVNVETGGVAEFSFKVRRWDGSPLPNYTVKYSDDQGSTWTSLPNIDGTLLTTSDFFTYSSGTINSSVTNFMIEIQNTGTTERIMIDDFSWTGYSGTSTPQVNLPVITASGIMKSLDTYFESAQVSISTSTSDAAIYYTLNGDEPTSSSTLYTAPIDLTSTTTIKAIGVKDEMDNSVVASKTITIVSPAVAAIPYAEAFNNTLGDWYTFEVSGTKPWFASANGAVANGFAGGDVESWLVSPEFTAPEGGVVIAFNYASRYTGNPIEVKMSSNYSGFGSPAAANWTTLTSIAAPEVQDDSYTLKATGNILAPVQGKLHFALVYDRDVDPYSDWRITNLSVNTPPTSPTIVVSELAIPAMSAVVGSTDAETVTVSGLNLTAGIQVAVTGADAALFTLSHSELIPIGGSVTDASITITYTPTAAGSHTATLTLNTEGAEEVTRSLSGTATWAPLNAPLALDASGVSPNAFTANWEAVAGATNYEVYVYTKEGSNLVAADLFISEYIEGSSNNKAIEIYNGTGASVDLSKYSVHTFANGSATATYTLNLSGTLEHNDVYVVYNASANTAIKAVGNVESNVTFYNGDDAIALLKEGVLIDIFGEIGNDPGAAWTADGGYSTLDKTLIRKSSVIEGVSVNPVGLGFPTLSTEWDVYAIDFVADLGTHSFDGADVQVTHVDGSPFTVTGETSLSVTGLTPATTYYYYVVAKNENVSSVSSNEVSVVTDFGTNTERISVGNIRAVDGTIRFTASANETVEVYNAIGQRIVNTTAVEGFNAIRIDAKGIMIVKVGSRIAKVIL